MSQIDAEAAPASRTSFAAPVAAAAAAVDSFKESVNKNVKKSVEWTKRQLWTARITRAFTMVILLSIILVTTIMVELHGPDLFWKRSTSRPMIYYEVEAGPHGEWELSCIAAKSPDGKCTAHLQRYPLVVYGALSTRPWKDHIYFSEPRAIISSMSQLTSWTPHYELLRGLTLGAFSGDPLLAVIFEPAAALKASPTFNLSDFGTPAQVAGMAYVAVNEANGHVGMGDEAEKLWETDDPWFPFACYRYWRGGGFVDPAEGWGTQSCGGFDLIGYLKYQRFVITMVYFLCSMVLAAALSVYSLWLLLRIINRWKLSQFRLMERSPLFAVSVAALKRHAKEQSHKEQGEGEAPAMRELLAKELPLIVYLECAIAKLDGDAFNMLFPREGIFCALLQAAYMAMLAAPVHIWAVFTSRPNTPTNTPVAFTSLWSLPTYFLITHCECRAPHIPQPRAPLPRLSLQPRRPPRQPTVFPAAAVVASAALASASRLCSPPSLPPLGSDTVHGVYIISHYIGVSVRKGMRYTPFGRIMYAAYYYWTVSSIALAIYLIFWLSLWLCTAVAVNPDYVIKLLSVLASIISLFFVSLGTAEKFAVETEKGFSQVQGEAHALVNAMKQEVNAFEEEAKRLEEGAMAMAAFLDLHGKRCVVRASIPSSRANCPADCLADCPAVCPAVCRCSC